MDSNLTNDNGLDTLFKKAVEVVVQYDNASASLIQRRLAIGYARAARLIDQLEQVGVIGPADGAKPRYVLINSIDEFNKNIGKYFKDGQPIGTKSAPLFTPGMTRDQNKNIDIFNEAVKIAAQYETITSSTLQKRLSLGYAHTARIMDLLEESGVISTAMVSKPHKVLIHTSEEIASKLFTPNYSVDNNSLSIEDRLSQIEERNKRVEVDKAWETSTTRRGLLILFTYLSIGLYMYTIGVTDPWLNAVIPSLGFLLSTLTLPFFKDIWKKNQPKM